MKVLVTIPVLNEEKVLEKNTMILFNFLNRNLLYQWEMLIVDNGSTDKTAEIGKKLSLEKSGSIKYLHLEKKGRGRALKKSWSQSDADIMSYMDIDLSTNLDAFPKMIQQIIDGADIAIGSRLLKESHTKRQLKRQILSRAYNLLIKLMFQNKFSDAQCGFKAVSRKVVLQLLPKIKDNSWFFDTELLLLAEKNNYKIADQPIEWIEDHDTRVKILKTALDDIRGLIRVRFNM